MGTFTLLWSWNRSEAEKEALITLRHICDILQTLDIVKQAHRRNRVTLTEFHKAFDAAEAESAAQALQELDGMDPVQVLVRYRGELLEEFRISYDEELDAILIEVV